MMTENIKMLMVKRDMTGKDLANALGCSSQNVYSLLKKDDWRESQLQKIADALDCDMRIEFELRDTHEIFKMESVKNDD